MMEELTARFRAYTEGFLTGEPESDASVRLKIDHSFRVRSEAMNLAAAENFPPELARQLEFAALLHDYGRFEQYRQYRTFRDDRSLNHGLLSAQLCARHRLLDGFQPAERGEILAAIRVHNARVIPAQLKGRARILAGAVRDADKLDILDILLTELASPANADILLNLPLKSLSPAVAAYLARGESPPHEKLAGATDFIASKLAWVFDLNFPYSSREFRRRNHLERALAYLPDSEEIRQLYRLCRARLEKDAKEQYITE